MPPRVVPNTSPGGPRHPPHTLSRAFRLTSQTFRSDHREDDGANIREFRRHNESVYEAVQVFCDTEACVRRIEGNGNDLYQHCLRLITRSWVARNYEDRLGQLLDQELYDQVKPAGDDWQGQEVLRKKPDLEALQEAAILHDIGKSIAFEKHPVIGWHVLTDLESDARRKYIEAHGDERFRTLQILIRDHDKFGVLSTGEASLPILLSVAQYGGTNIEQIRARLAMLMILNLCRHRE